MQNKNNLYHNVHSDITILQMKNTSFICSQTPQNNFCWKKNFHATQAQSGPLETSKIESFAKLETNISYPLTRTRKCVRIRG